VKRERDLELRLASLRTLGQAVTAMKSLSAHHFHATRRALESTQTYREGIDRLLQSTGASLPAGDGPRGLVVIGGELGFCGGYNARVAAAAAEYRDEHGAGPTFCVGHRVATYLRRQGGELHQVYAAPNSVRGAHEALLKLAQHILEAYIDSGCSGFDVVSSRFRGVGAFHIAITQLLPVEISPSPEAPAPRYASSDHLAAVALRELLYITMVELLLDALASEHGARLVATQSAEQWLEERIAHMRRRLSAARREASTQEVIEISAGARARRRHGRLR
jgi:F-type H+-transporting ATPase subunit gamma